MSRPLNDVATLISLQADVLIASDSVLTSRPLLDVATSIFSFLKILCHDFYLVSRPPCLLFCIQFCHDLMWFFITVNASLQQILSSSCTSPAATSFSSSFNSFSASLGSWYCNTLFISNFLLHSSLVSYSTFLHINKFFLDKNQSEKWTENG